MSLVQPTPAPTLSQKCAALLRANAEVMGAVLKTLPKGKQQELEALLAGGGSVGIESTVNRNGTPRICLVGLEQEGTRLVLATVQNG